MARETVSHSGRIVSITPQTTTVEFISESACGACHAAGLCSISEMKKKVVEVPTSPYASFREGDEVEVVLRGTMGLKAVFISYMIPLVILLAVTLALNLAGASDLASGLSGIGAVAVYYFILWLLRDKMRKEYVFTIEEKQPKSQY